MQGRQANSTEKRLYTKFYENIQKVNASKIIIKKNLRKHSWIIQTKFDGDLAPQFSIG